MQITFVLFITIVFGLREEYGAFALKTKNVGDGYVITSLLTYKKEPIVKLKIFFSDEGKEPITVTLNMT